MKSIALALFALLASGSVFAQDTCSASAPPAVHFAVAYLSVLETGGIPYLDDYNTSGRTVEQICGDLLAFTVTPSKALSGYLDVTLRLSNNEVCTMPVQLAADGRVAASAQMSCSK